MMVQEEPQVPENKEISLYSIMSMKYMESKQNRRRHTFVYNIVLEMMRIKI